MFFSSIKGQPHHHHKTPTNQLRNHSHTINFHQYSLHYHCRHYHRQHHHHYPHRQYHLHQHYCQHHHYHQHQYTNQHPNTRPHAAQHPHPTKVPHTLYLNNHTPAVLDLNPSHLSPHFAESPVVGNLGGSPTIRMTATKGGHHHLASEDTPCSRNKRRLTKHSTQKKVLKVVLTKEIYTICSALKRA